MADVAARAGVSRALVSIVFRGVPGASNAARERVLRAAAELDYRPDQRARLLGRARSGLVGVVFGLHREFHGELVEQLYRAAHGTGYDLALGAVAPCRDEQTAVQSLLDYRCEALVLLGPTLRPSAIETLAARVPVVVVARRLRSRVVDVVRTDDVAGGRMAVHHLVEQGHRAITHVDGRRAPGAAERRRGYREAMRELDLLDGVRLLPGGLNEVDGEAAGELLVRDGLPTAVTAFNDHCAAGLMALVRARGVRVPEDLSVVGYDDSGVASLTSIALTTVAQDAATLARSALRRALVRAGGDDEEPTEVIIPPRLAVRRTTSPPGSLR